MVLLVFEASGRLETPNYCQLEAIFPCFENLTVDTLSFVVRNTFSVCSFFKDFLEVKPNFLIFWVLENTFLNIV